MTSFKIALGEIPAPKRPTLPRPSWLLRLRAHLEGPALDRRLALGATIRECPLLRERAALLTSERQRRSLAAGLELALREANSGARGRRVPVDGAAVRDARPALESLAARLLDGSEVSPRGMARVRLLLTDGFGPLYEPGEDGALLEGLTEARRALDSGR